HMHGMSVVPDPVIQILNSTIDHVVTGGVLEGAHVNNDGVLDVLLAIGEEDHLIVFLDVIPVADGLIHIVLAAVSIGITSDHVDGDIVGIEAEVVIIDVIDNNLDVVVAGDVVLYVHHTGVDVMFSVVVANVIHGAVIVDLIEVD